MPCSPAAPNDPQPWVYESSVLNSFRLEIPAPQYVGDFLDQGSYYWLTLWRDERGFFGSLASPVVDQDSPSAPIKNVQWVPITKVLRFTASPSVKVEMIGVLTATEFRVTNITGGFSSEFPVLLFEDKQEGAEWRSRAQFECAMKMWRRD